MMLILLKNFNNATCKVLEKRGVPIHKIIEFIDQVPSQYKSKTAFRYLCQQNIPMERNYFGGMGKVHVMHALVE